MTNIYEDHKELTVEEFKTLKQKCLDARDLALPKYSGLYVGCSILTEDGTYYMGGNLENVAHTATICAERSAMTVALMHDKTYKFKAIAVSSTGKNIISPCGVCRQFIREFTHVELPVFMMNTDGKWKKMYLKDLLPFSYDPEFLEENL